MACLEGTARKLDSVLTMFEPSDLVGRTLDGRYHVEELLGSGAMGSVFRARHVRLSRSFAIKVLHPRWLSHEKTLRRFEREAQLAGKLSHPNVIGVIDVGEVDGASYMVMELAAGPSLGDVIGRVPIERGRAIRLLRQLCDGLDHAHAQGLIHRDLKPENVIVETHDGEEVARIVDFGISLLRDPDTGKSSSEGRLTTTGIVLGTPQYMAPEVALDKPFDHRIDLFALGVIAFEMLTACMPFDGSGVEVLHCNVSQDAPPFAARAPGIAVDRGLEAFVHKLMARDPAARYPSAAAARDALDRIRNITITGSGFARAARSWLRASTEDLPAPEVVALGSMETCAIVPLEKPAATSEPEPAATSPSPSRSPYRSP
jgi:serine/threonine-protein kinase